MRETGNIDHEAFELKRRKFIALMGAAAAWPSVGRAEQAPRLRRIGVLHPGQISVANMRIAAFREGLRISRSLDASNMEVIARIAEGNIAKLTSMATELVALGVELLLAVSPTGLHAAHAATKTIPVIAVDLESDPIARGWAESLARPGGNITGVFLDIPEFSAKCLEVLREAVPAASKLSILWDPTVGSAQLKAVERAAIGLDVMLHVLEVRRIGDLGPAFRAMIQANTGGVLMLSSPLFSSSTQLVADLALQHLLPAMMLFPDFAEKGGLLAYGPDLQALFQQAGRMAIKLLRGVKPAELPIERPTLFQLVVNLRTARTLGLTPPQSLVLRADDVIE